MTRFATATALILCAPWLVAAAAEPDVYGTVSKHYEAIRLILLHDSNEGVAPHAEEIVSVARAGAGSVENDAVRELLPDLADAAEQVRSAPDLATTRDRFYALSQVLAKYRHLVPSPGTVVVFCPMAEKAWIQPDGEIGNPYHGQEMPRCGRVVSK